MCCFLDSGHCFEVKSGEAAVLVQGSLTDACTQRTRLVCAIARKWTNAKFTTTGAQACAFSWNLSVALR